MKNSVINNSVDSNVFSRFDVFQNKRVFSHLDKCKDISFVIKSRKNLDRGDVHSVQFQVEVPHWLTQDQLMAVAQKIVKETLTYEQCHGITIDFTSAGYVDFAPFGNWDKVGEVPVNKYKDYGFKYSPPKK